jgi:hypothetical protein
MQIYYRGTNSDLGWLLLAATERGICTITMGDAPGRVVELLEQQFPAARCGCARLGPWMGGSRSAWMIDGRLRNN